MPIKLYKKGTNGSEIIENVVVNKLKRRPNYLTSPTIFWTTIENNRNHHGNAYVWIRKKKSAGGIVKEILDFWILQSENVEIIVNNRGIFETGNYLYYKYTDPTTGKIYVFEDSEILHFKTSCTFDGLVGRSVREILLDTLQGTIDSQNFMNTLYKNGLTAKVGVEVDEELNEEKVENILKYLESYGSGFENSGGFLPIPLGVKLSPLNIKLTDAQFFELKKYTALEIAGAFGIKPTQLNNYEKSSYSSDEMQKLDFYVDTLQYIQKQYEEELNYKLLTEEEIREGYYWKFDEKAILRSDPTKQMQMLQKGVATGIYTPNEARSIVDLPEIEGGNSAIVNGAYIPLEMVGQQYVNVKGGEEEDEKA